MSNAAEVTDQNFEEQVLKSDLPVLVDFWATWCGPCRALAPTIDQLAEEFAGKLKVVKLDTDQNIETATKFQIMSIPTLLLFKGGKTVEQMVGAQPKAALVGKITPHLG
ncbi:MAG TPA: thioredoxin [Armatimonadota bacterium]|jgi:thioredoxin 1